MVPVTSHAIPKNEPASAIPSDTGRAGKLLKDNSVPKPDKYNGTPDWHTYRAFSHSLMIYFRLSGLPAEYHVYYMSHFITGSARKHYNDHILGFEHQYDLESALRKLFDLCFPPDFRARQRIRFDSLYMGSFSVVQFARELQSIASLLPDITERQLALRFFFGSKPYIQDKLSDAGYNAET
ncbi:hypothetical protein SISNIDRAFT_408942, partial [Sistotremastrum niveocremeum HHB9708]